jgi:uncharacterized membrane protein HdeD (DUF308 family)
MTDHRSKQAFYEGKMYRLLTAALGILLAGVGFYALIFADTSLIVRLLGGLACVLAGYNMLSSACKAKESWLSKRGPLP